MNKDNKKLTEREIQVLNLLKYSMTNEQIAQELCISTNTAHAHRVSIHQKLDVHDRLKAVLTGIQLGYIKLGKDNKEEG